MSKDFFLPDGLFDLSNSAVTDLFEARAKLDALVKKYELSNATKPVYYAILAAIAVYGTQKGAHKKSYTFTNLYTGATASQNQTAPQATTVSQKTNTAALGSNMAALANYTWPQHVSANDVISLCEKIRDAGPALRNTKD